MDIKHPIRITLKALDGRILHLGVDNHPKWCSINTFTNKLILDDGLFGNSYVYTVIYETFLYSFVMSDKDVTIAKMLGLKELPFNEHVTITSIWL